MTKDYQEPIPEVIKKKLNLRVADPKMQERVEGLNKDLAMSEKQLQAVDLGAEFGSEVNVVQDIETELSFLETEIPPIVQFDEETGKMLCEDPALARLIRIVTNGDPEKIQRIVKSRNLRMAILRDQEGWIRLKLMANYVTQAIESKPNDPGKRVLEMIDANEQPSKPKRSVNPHRDKEVARNILGVDGKG